MAKTLNILHCVESYPPSVGGMQEVVRQLSERLVKLGHKVTVATKKHEARKTQSINGVQIIDFEISGNAVIGIKGEKDRYEEFLLQSDYDVVTFFAAQQWATDVALPILKRIKGRKVAVPTGYSGLYWKDYATYFENMKTWIHDFDMNVYLSNNYRDINFARDNGVEKICLIPNGAGEDEFSKSDKINVRQKLKLKPDSFLLLHVGSFTGKKGHQEAVELFLRSNAKNACLLLIGNNHEQFKTIFNRNPRLYLLRLLAWLKGNRIIIGYYNREFTVAAYKQSNLFLFPSNIECSPIVLFECAAAKIPFLASEVGNSAEIASWTQGGEIMPTQIDEAGESHIVPAPSLVILNAFLQNKINREKMAENAYQAWKQKYSWEKISLQYESLYLSLLG